MKYRGREIDPLALWANYVEFPPNVKIDGEFLPLVVCPNPEHDTRKRHFQINTEKGLVHCFARCGISGTYARAISIIEGIPEREARRVILRHATLAGRESRRGVPARHFNRRDGLRGDGGSPTEIQSLEYSTYIPEAGLAYLKRRGISDSAVAHFGIGWDKEDLRIVIPAKDLNGQTRLLIKRAVKGKQFPKYLYSEGFPKTSLLFGACDLDPALIESAGIVLVEGSLDRINLWQLGITTAVATLGTGISEIQSRIVERFQPPVVYLMFDRDSSGVHGIQIARQRLPKANLRVCRYPRGRFDPGEFQGKEAHRSIARAVPISKLFNPNARPKEISVG